MKTKERGMKNKSKKVLKAVGVGALACVGAMAFAGCSKVEVSQKKVDNVIETVEKSNQYMDSQLELLRAQNAKLEAQLAELVKQNENLSGSDVDEIIEQLKDSNENMLSQIEVLESQNSFLETQLAELVKQNENLSGSDVDEIIEQLQASNENMATQIELLESQNANLEAQLQQIIAESKKMTKEEAINFAKRADYRLMMNIDGLRDNMLYSVGDPSGDFKSFKDSYYNVNGIKATLNEDVDETWVTYQLGENKIVSSSIKLDGQEYYSNSIYQENDSSVTFDKCIGIYQGNIPSLASLNLTEDDLLCYEVLSNDNLKLVFSRNVIEYSHVDDESYVECLQIYEFEYSKDCKIISCTGKSVVIDSYGPHADLDEADTFDMKITVEYGTVDVELITHLIEVSENRRKGLELAKQSDANLINNTNGIRDNLVTLISNGESELPLEVNAFYADDNVDVLINAEDSLDVIYQKQGENVVVNAIVAVAPTGAFTYISHNEEVGSFGDNGEMIQILPTLQSIGLSEADCKKVEVLENGNYKLYFEQLERNYDHSDEKYEDIMNYYTSEYSKDGKILNMTWTQELISRSEGFDMNDTAFYDPNANIEVKYDVIPSEIIYKLIALIESNRT